jgi:AraC family transcriptional regulator
VDSCAKTSDGSLEFGARKFGTQGVVASSSDLGWSGLAAALRTHDRGVIEWESAAPATTVCVAMCPSNSLVTARLDGRAEDRTTVERGRIWLTPRGLPGGRLDFAGPVPQVLHVYLPSSHFSADSLGSDFGHAAHASLHYEKSFQDSLVAEIAFAIAAELRTPTTGGKLLAETLAASLAARLVQRHAGISPSRDFVRPSNQGLDRRRLARVKEYIAANLEGDLTIVELAKVASLSRFHFARAFKAAVGQSPHRYISIHRLERAKELLARGDQSLLEISIALNFSSQANFTRAFHRGTGMTPGQYRRSFTQSEKLSGSIVGRSPTKVDASRRLAGEGLMRGLDGQRQIQLPNRR